MAADCGSPSAEAMTFLSRHPGLETVDLLLPDINGILRGKRIGSGALSKVFEQGVCFPPSLFAADITGETAEDTGLGFSIGDLDLVCRPVPDSLRPVPWAAHPGAQLLLTMFAANGQPFTLNPRQVLQQVEARLQARGLQPVVAVELEFYLTDHDRDDHWRPQPPLSPTTGERDNATQVYGIAELDSYGEFIHAVAKAAQTQSIPADTVVAEYAPGQFEVNLEHCSGAVSACDDGIMLKRLIKAIAEQQGMVATFMAKPYSQHAGSGMHIHISLLDSDGNNVFVGKEGRGSDSLLHAIAGLQTTMGESMLLFAPHANSYRRFVREAFVPLSPCWGYNNRTVALRIPAGASEALRIEHRVAGADANPYLVTAALLAGIDHGLARQQPPTAETQGNAYRQIPPSLPRHWLQSLAAFRTAQILPGYLGEEFCRVFAALKDEELERFQQLISDIEYQWYWRNI